MFNLLFYSMLFDLMGVFFLGKVIFKALKNRRIHIKRKNIYIERRVNPLKYWLVISFLSLPLLAITTMAGIMVYLLSAFLKS